MNPLKRLFKQTFIYGLATVLPRVLSFLLVPLYTSVMNPETYGEISVIFSWFAIFNVVLAYGMETAFFRFFNKHENKEHVISTSLLSLLLSSLIFFVAALMFKETFASIIDVKESLIIYIILILVLDALAIVPFAWLRAKERPLRYSIVKVTSVAINLLLNIFFLTLLPKMAENGQPFWSEIYKDDFQIEYVFIANVISSGVAFLWISGIYFDTKYKFDKQLWKEMLKYSLPIMIAGLAFTVNEVFDRILLDRLLPEDIAKAEIGKYSACYKLAVFMTLFGTAFRLGVEPFFFSHANTENPKKAYAQVTNYFVIMGSLIFLGVMVFIDPLKKLLVRDQAFWEALDVVPIILLASFCLGIYHNLSVWYKVTDRTKFGAYISSVGAIITLVINISLIPKIGYMASALATLAAYGSMMLLSYHFGKKYYPVPYNMRKIVFYLSVSLVFSIFSFYVFNRNLIAGSILFLLFLGLVYKMEGDKLRSIFIKREN
ncbi:oligosaccharide flippase family protein [Muricauda sp. 334s03]|uniref:Oligosaccharide flippase family protein n=1 Tax=Flagellimonas yonaguniensis TaxID=3031325 RepID=A0ABT5XU72_9FLAO|nr:oligosaccharide flippase family protein [[Muricauda] yonaguniensis]MDF0714736.1 oligosaccharide flippase family protein [[Muricauda] yonaguniensis]